ncbi:hypothetical protein WJX81_002114 [Elliptochloris bilobata]|uniref:phosphoribosylaminoimidazolesuccinocarboxamide synthase n=1 Tax=Elliptochloris bilobata TaxID=381761 RepID=A0AAW1QJD5_9CHLO
MKLSAQAAGALSRPEELVGLRPDIDASIKASLHMCLTKTNLGLGKRTVGKARDTYEVGDKLVIVTTDRQSAFDRILAAIPFKGQVLNQTSAWWMRGTQHIAPNALLAVPDPNVSVMRRCQVFPVEFVVRGYLTGYTATSLWTHYSAGAREYCGNSFSDGMRKNDRLEANVVTPTTKAADHDKPIAPQDIVARGLMSQADWDQVSATALALFEHGQREAAQRGLLLVDTKYEFGVDADGRILLVDEIHTPDSSRYWLADSYAERHAAGQEPQSIDKEFLRLWFRANCDPYADAELPAAPEELVVELARRYVLLYETITGQRFEPAPVGQERAQGMAASTRAALEAL